MKKPKTKPSRSRKIKSGLRPGFVAFIRNMATRSPDVIRVWQSAHTTAEKEVAKKAIIRNGRAKAALRDEIAGFVRTLTLENLRVAHKSVFDIHTGQVILKLLPQKGPRRGK